VTERFQRLSVEADDPALAEEAAAEAHALGASGLEEREDGEGRTQLIVYAPAAIGAALREALGALAAVRSGRIRVSALEDVEEVDWSERWRDGLRTIVISERLAVRPSFVAATEEEAEHTLLVDPGQAFGTGGHASTRLALAELDSLPPGAVRGARVLDVGSGTGVLALAALALGAAEALGVDTDSLATEAARANAEANGLAEHARFVTGSTKALHEPPFGLVLANLLRTEVLPLLPEIAAALAPGGLAIFSGLLACEEAEMRVALGEVGLTVRSTRIEVDDTDRWLGILTQRT